MLAQYPYVLNKDSGLTALQYISHHTLLSLERVYNRGKRIVEVNLFLTDCRKASPIQNQIRMETGFTACEKKWLWGSSQDPSLKVDNLEAMTVLDLQSFQEQEGLLLVLASDNNFNEEEQKNPVPVF